MPAAAAPLTLQLALLLGLVMLASGIGGWLRPHGWDEMMGEFGRSPGLVLAVAFLGILFGALILMFHWLWTGPLAIAVTVIGIASFLEGLLLLAVPDLYLNLVRPWLRYARAWAAFALVFGAILVTAAVLGHRNLYS